MLSGHTHGGQICLPGVGPLIVPSRYGTKYAQGMVQGPICPVYVSRGVGVSVLPIRFNAVPELTMFELRTA
jgi:predicted MPP superfamily phosphohydrolase